MALRRGFKTEANWYARSFRQDMGLSSHDPLCPRKLAHHLEIPLISLVNFMTDIPDAVSYLHGPGQNEFSAVTIFNGMEKIILFNDAHSPKRQAADISHELSHIILQHPPKPPIGPDGSRHYDLEIEEEANWLGPALLVSDEAAVWIARNRMSIAAASDFFGVSEDLVRMRVNVCGAYRRH